MRLLITTSVLMVLGGEAAAQTRSADLPSPDSSRAPLILSVAPESALAQAKQLAASRLLQALQSGDEVLLQAEYAMADQSKGARTGACSSLLPALTALRTSAGRPAGKLPKGKHLPVYFFGPLSFDSAGRSLYRVSVVVPRPDGRRKITPVTLEFESASGRWISASALNTAICP